MYSNVMPAHRNPRRQDERAWLNKSRAVTPQMKAPIVLFTKTAAGTRGKGVALNTAARATSTRNTAAPTHCQTLMRWVRVRGASRETRACDMPPPHSRQSSAAGNSNSITLATFSSTGSVPDR